MYHAPLCRPQEVLDLGAGNCSWAMYDFPKLYRRNLLSLGTSPISTPPRSSRLLIDDSTFPPIGCLQMSCQSLMTSMAFGHTKITGSTLYIQGNFRGWKTRVRWLRRHSAVLSPGDGPSIGTSGRDPTGKTHGNNGCPYVQRFIGGRAGLWTSAKQLKV